MTESDIDDRTAHTEDSHIAIIIRTVSLALVVILTISNKIGTVI